MREVVAQLDLKVRAIQRALAIQLRNIELPLLFFRPFLVEGWGGEYETQFVNLLQFFLQGLEGIDGERCSSHRHLRAVAQHLFEVVDNPLSDIVELFR